MLDQHDDSMRNIYKIENGHEDKSCQLEIMNLASKSRNAIDLVIDAYTHNHRNNNQVDGLCYEALVHHRYDIGCFSVVLFDKDYI